MASGTRRARSRASPPEEAAGNRSSSHQALVEGPAPQEQLGQARHSAGEKRRRTCARSANKETMLWRIARHSRGAPWRTGSTQYAAWDCATSALEMATWLGTAQSTASAAPGWEPTPARRRLTTVYCTPRGRGTTRRPTRSAGGAPDWRTAPPTASPRPRRRTGRQREPPRIRMPPLQ